MRNEPESVFKSGEGRRAVLAKYDAVLSRWPEPKSVRDVPTRHGRTRVVLSGPEGAPPVVFLHGSTSNAMSWLGEAATLSRTFRVIAPDMPGEPGYSEETRFPLAGPAPEEWMDDVLAALGLGRILLAGMSLGGWTALRYASRRPGRVERLVLLCPAGAAPARASFLLKSLLLIPRGRKGVERLASLVYGNADVPREAVDYTILMGESFRPRMESPPVFSDAELALIDCPVLYIGGLNDALLRTRRSAERLARLLPDFRAELDPGAGHVLPGRGERILEFFLGGPAGPSSRPPTPVPGS